MTIRILINGAAGRMGQITVPAVQNDARFELVGTAVRGDDLAQKITQTSPNVVVDLTNPASVFENTRTIISAGVHPVVGTTGLLPEQITALQALAAKKSLGGIIAPNFSLGVILLMRFAAQAAQYFPYAEIIELHHDKKKDAPSGTALKTAQLLTQVRANQRPPCEEIVAGARGANVNEVPIHSVRLPGLLAHEEVLFGSEGELLTLRHDAFNRSTYMPGLLLACEKVSGLNGLVYGLEHVLDL